MVKQIDLRKVIRAKLLTVCSKVYYGKAKGVPDAEYVVFSIDRSYRELSKACS